jgi:hypothetical protein
MTAFATGLQLLDAVGNCLSVALLIYGAYLACVSRFGASQDHAQDGAPKRQHPSGGAITAAPPLPPLSDSRLHSSR